LSIDNQALSIDDGSPGLGDPADRLRAIPWDALAGLGPALAEALRPVLRERERAQPADSAVSDFLRARPALTRPQRRAAAYAIFGVALWRRRLLCAAGGEPGAPDPSLLLCALLRDLGGVSEAQALALSGCARVPGRGEPRSWGERLSFPAWLEQRLTSELGDEAEAFAHAVSSPGPIFLRSNRLLNDRAQLAAALRAEGVETTPCRFAPDGLRVLSERPNLLPLPSYRAGRFEVQDEGSQLLGALVEAQPGDSVLDACAGAGGKSLQLAAALEGRGRVLCADPDRERLARLQARARRAHARCVALDDPAIAPLVDRALADVPCSALGALRRGPDARWRLDPASLDALPGLQRSILESAAARVRPGGRLVYATCTVLRAENQAVALDFERTHPGFIRRVPGEGWLDPSLVDGGFFRALPHRHGTDGFFAAVWDRLGDVQGGVV
jgi:16S rRNA (cytosine967-C5)-methyltransferase